MSQASSMLLSTFFFSAGTRMRYPSNFVLVTADVETDLVNRNPGLGPVLQSPHVSLTSLTPPSSPLNGSMMAGAEVPLKVIYIKFQNRSCNRSLNNID